MMGYRTPNIDRIAKEGALFTDWYGQQSCTAGRACLSLARRVSGPACSRSVCRATAGIGARLGLIVHHTDTEREWAYDRKSSVGRLDKALDEASLRGWTVVSIKDDWRRLFPFDNQR